MPITIDGTGTVTGISAGGLPAGTVTEATLSSSVIQLVAPAGAIAFVCQSTAPNGWLKANGAAVSRTTYSTLFTAIGTTFGVGNGSTTFNLPDMRGEFPRGWDDSRGVDSGRGFGALQAQNTVEHKHQLSMGFDGNTFYGWQDAGSTPIFGSGVTTGNRTTVAGTTGINQALRISFSDFMRDQTGEVRPRNIALLAVIKF